MRVFGRVVPDIKFPNITMWVVVETTANGLNDYVYVTALIQCLKLNLGESPFYANSGIPAHQSVVTQVQPDFYVTRTQKAYAQFFASLIIAKTSASPPTYRVNILTHAGVPINLSIAF